MRQSKLFTKTIKETPKDEVSMNAKLLIQAGYVYKEMAGVYAYLPLGLRVLEKIKDIVRKEMEAIGGNELIMTSLQRKSLWEKTNRWDDKEVDVWFKSTLKNGTEVGFGWSHEEPITDMMKTYLTSYRNLPAFVFQFQTKMRNELRAKSGIMRGREFVMKDMYSYTTNEEQHQEFYDKTIQAYLNIFEQVGLRDDTFVTSASGGAFTEFSHEFQTITDAGEDIVYINKEKNIAVNEEIMNDDVLQKMGVTKEELTPVKTAEVGNIFNFGTAKSEQLDLHYTDQDGKSIPVFLGSYGIGITRLMGVIVEKFSDEKGIVWPKSVAPYQVHLVSLAKDNSEESYKKATEVYEMLKSAGVEVLFDDRFDARAGQKFADSDLIGLPVRVVVSKKSLENGGLEVKLRNSKDASIVSQETLIETLDL